MGCGTATMKSLLFCFNVVFCIGAIALIGIGGAIQWFIRTDPDTAQDHSLNAVSLVTIAVGAIALLIAFFGCWGVVHDSKCLLLTYAVLVTLILIVQFACGISLMVMSKEEIRTQHQKTLEKVLEAYKEGGDKRDILDTLQSSLHCCGVNGKTDFVKTLSLPPESCNCANKDSDDCFLGLYKDSCVEKLTDITDTLKHSYGVVVIISAVLELLLVVFACILAHRKHENKF